MPAGQPTPRGLLLTWTFEEMRPQIRAIAKKLLQMSKDDPQELLNAGPPFELP